MPRPTELRPPADFGVDGKIVPVGTGIGFFPGFAEFGEGGRERAKGVEAHGGREAC